MKLLPRAFILSLFFISTLSSMNFKIDVLKQHQFDNRGADPTLQNAVESFEDLLAELSDFEKKDATELEKLAKSNITLQRLKMARPKDMHTAVKTEIAHSRAILQLLKKELVPNT